MTFFIKALLDKTIYMCGDKWKWYFTGITYGQYGFGFIKREKISEITNKETN